MGSGHNLVSRNRLRQQEFQGLRDSNSALTLSIANGVARAKQITNSVVTGLAETVEMRVLDHTPRVLSV